MKTCVTTYSFNQYLRETKSTPYQICDIAKGFGFDGIEFVDLYNENWGWTEDKLTLAKKLGEYCRTIDLPVVAYCVGANLLADDIDDQIARLKENVDVASLLGAPVMRHDVAYAKRDIEGYDYHSAIDEIAPIVREITEYAQSKGVKTCSENHGFFFQAPETVESLIKAVNHPNYGWLCDIGNFMCADANPLTSTVIASKYAFHCHAKDFHYTPKTEEKPENAITTTDGNYIVGAILGEGVVPVATCLTVLKKAGYDGYVTVEFEGREDSVTGVKKGLRFLKNIIAEQ